MHILNISPCILPCCHLSAFSRLIGWQNKTPRQKVSLDTNHTKQLNNSNCVLQLYLRWWKWRKMVWKLPLNTCYIMHIKKIILNIIIQTSHFRNVEKLFSERQTISSLAQGSALNIQYSSLIMDKYIARKRCLSVCKLLLLSSKNIASHGKSCIELTDLLTCRGAPAKSHLVNHLWPQTSPVDFSRAVCGKGHEC